VALVQNVDDAALVEQTGVPIDRIRQINGSGVDLTRFVPSPEPAGPPMVLFPARLLRDKGLLEFIAAARDLRQHDIDARFVLAGAPDLNPTSVSHAEVNSWVQEGVVECLGWVEDMAPLMAAAAIVCLPSYREGLPKALAEAAAAGRPIVATDVPGCRAVVDHGHNGLLVPPRDAAALADALRQLLADPERRRAMGAQGRRRAQREFSVETVIQKTLALYSETGS
jgi:glycosyltransferase involved in cell wall biosynthesis